MSLSSPTTTDLQINTTASLLQISHTTINKATMIRRDSTMLNHRQITTTQNNSTLSNLTQIHVDLIPRSPIYIKMKSNKVAAERAY